LSESVSLVDQSDFFLREGHEERAEDFEEDVRFDHSLGMHVDDVTSKEKLGERLVTRHCEKVLDPL